MFYKEIQISEDKIITVWFDADTFKFSMDFVDNAVKSIYFTKQFDSLDELFTSLKECLEKDCVADIDSFAAKSSFKERCFLESKEQINKFYVLCIIEEWGIRYNN